MKLLTVLCVILALHGSTRVIADSSLSKEDALVRKMNDVVELYNEKLDKKVKWEVLNEAVESIQNLFKGYHGKAKDNMQALLEENTKAYDEYLFAVGPLFQWCGSVKYDLPYTVSVIQKPNLTDSARTYIRDRIANLLLRGVNQSKDSIDHIQLAIKHMSQLSVKLNMTELQIDEDFSSNGFYGIERSKLVSEMANKKLESGLIALVIAAFGLLCTAILAFVAGPVGIAVGLAVTFLAAGIPPAVVYGHTIPSLQQQITMIDEFYKKLQDALIRAKKECETIDKALETELTDINQLAADIKTPQPNDLMDPFFSDHFVNGLNTLSVSCTKYVESHRSTTSRRRRAAVAEKAPMTPGNYTFDAGMLLNENYGVMHETVFANLKQFFSDPLISRVF